MEKLNALWKNNYPDIIAVIIVVFVVVASMLSEEAFMFMFHTTMTILSMCALLIVFILFCAVLYAIA